MLYAIYSPRVSHYFDVDRQSIEKDPTLVRTYSSIRAARCSITNMLRRMTRWQMSPLSVYQPGDKLIIHGLNMIKVSEHE